MTASNGWKSHFDLGDSVYLNGANQGPFPRVAIAAIDEALAWKRDPSSINDEIYFTLPDRVRRAAARFFGCEPQELAVTTGASTGIGVLASGFDWKAGDRVIIPAGEFPANYLPWYALRSRGVEVTVLPVNGGLSRDQIEAAMTNATRLVAVGYVNFATGYRADIDAIGALCDERGVAFLVDASQGLAAVPLDVGRCKATVVTAAGYKWMCSPYGTGLFYVHRDWVERLPVPVVNWSAVRGAEDFNKLTDLEVDYRPGAARWDAPETASFLNCMPMAASLEFLGEIGIDRIYAHALGLLDRLIAGLPAGFRSDSSLEPANRSTILRLIADDPERTRRAYQRCLEAGISVSMRESGIRVSPGVWNETDDVDRLLDQLHAA